MNYKWLLLFHNRSSNSTSATTTESIVSLKLEMIFLFVLFAQGFIRLDMSEYQEKHEVSRKLMLSISW